MTKSAGRGISFILVILMILTIPILPIYSDNEVYAATGEMKVNLADVTTNVAIKSSGGSLYVNTTSALDTDFKLVGDTAGSKVVLYGTLNSTSSSITVSASAADIKTPVTVVLSDAGIHNERDTEYYNDEARYGLLIDGVSTVLELTPNSKNYISSASEYGAATGIVNKANLTITGSGYLSSVMTNVTSKGSAIGSYLSESYPESGIENILIGGKAEVYASVTRGAAIGGSHLDEDIIQYVDRSVEIGTINILNASVTAIAEGGSGIGNGNIDNVSGDTTISINEIKIIDSNINADCLTHASIGVGMIEPGLNSSYTLYEGIDLISVSNSTLSAVGPIGGGAGSSHGADTTIMDIGMINISNSSVSAVVYGTTAIGGGRMDGSSSIMNLGSINISHSSIKAAAKDVVQGGAAIGGGFFMHTGHTSMGSININNSSVSAIINKAGSYSNSVAIGCGGIDGVNNGSSVMTMGSINILNSDVSAINDDGAAIGIGWSRNTTITSGGINIINSNVYAKNGRGVAIGGGIILADAYINMGSIIIDGGFVTAINTTGLAIGTGTGAGTGANIVRDGITIESINLSGGSIYTSGNAIYPSPQSGEGEPVYRVMIPAIDGQEGKDIIVDLGPRLYRAKTVTSHDANGEHGESFPASAAAFIYLPSKAIPYNITYGSIRGLVNVVPTPSGLGNTLLIPSDQEISYSISVSAMNINKGSSARLVIGGGSLASQQWYNVPPVVNWEVSPSGIVTLSSLTGGSVTATGIQPGIVEITARSGTFNTSTDITVDPDYYTFTASAATGGSISPAGVVSVEEGTDKTFDISADPGYVIKAIKVDGNSITHASIGAANGSYTFTGVNGAHSIAVEFVKLHTITANATTGGSIDPAGVVSVEEGADKAFNIVADPGYRIKEVKVDGTVVTASSIGTASGIYTLSNVTGNHTVTVEFVILHLITASVTTGGSIDPVGIISVDEGANKTFNITADSGYVIKAIKVDGTSITDPAIGTASGSYTISNVSKDQTIQVDFAKLYTITASAATGGSIDPNGAISVQEGLDKTFNIIADDGYMINEVKVDGATVTSNSIGITNGAYTISNVTGVHTIDVSFKLIPAKHTITASAAAGGSINPSGIVSVEDGTDKTFDLTADTGYVIRTIVIDGNPITHTAIGTANGSYTFTGVTSAHTIAVEYAKLYTITASATTGGSIDPNGAISVQEGLDKTFNIIADDGYMINEVKVDGATVTSNSIGITNGAYTISNVTGVHTIDVSFKLIPAKYSITASATTGGSISPAGVVTVEEGADKSFDITADSGYVIKEIKVDGTEVTGPAIGTPSGNYTISNVDKDQTISVDFAKLYTITASATTGGSIDPDGAVTVQEGKDKAFDITADSGYVIKEIKVNGTSVMDPAIGTASGSYTITNVDKDQTISVDFAKLYTITASASTGGNIDPNGTVTVQEGADQLFYYMADTGCVVKSIKVDGTEVTGSVIGTTNGSYTITSVDKDQTISIDFAKLYTITASATTGGSIDPNGAIPVQEGLDKTFNIIADDGYMINEVKVDGATVTSNSIGITNGAYTISNVTGVHTIDVSFKLIPAKYSITASATTGGSISPAGVVTVEEGADKSFDITADSGYVIKAIKVDGTEVTDPITGTTSGNYTISNVDKDQTISVDFAKLYTITASATTGGSIDPNGAVTVQEGKDKSFDITADSGYVIKAIKVDGSEVTDSSIGTASGSYTITSVDKDQTISVDFAKLYTITASATTGGSIDPDGAVTVQEGKDKAFDITADSGYVIKAIKVDGSEVTDSSIGTTSGSYTISNVDKNQTISVDFAKLYTITASATTGGSIDPDGAVTVQEGKDKAFNITADSGYVIKSIKVDGTSITDSAIGTASGSYAITNVDKDQTISVDFAKLYTITASAAIGGNISPAGVSKVEDGHDITYEFTADSGYIIKSIKIDGSAVSDSSIGTPNGTYTFSNVVKNSTIDIEFVEYYSALATATTGGSIDPSGVVRVIEGTDQIFDITADVGYVIKTIKIDNSPVTDAAIGNASGSYTVENISGGFTISVDFAKLYTITASATTGGSIDPNGAVSVQEGKDKTFDITADSGYVIKTIKVDGTSVTDSAIGTASGSYTITSVDKDQAISVDFAKLYTITASASTGGNIDPNGTVTVQEGKDKTFNIIADDGYMINEVKVDGATVTSNSIGITNGAYTISNVTGVHTIDVSFKLIPVKYSITASATTGGSISPAGVTQVEEGQGITYEFHAEMGHAIKSIKIDGSSITDSSIGTKDGVYTFSNVTEGHTIDIEFAKLHSIAANVTTGGSIDPSGEVRVFDGADQIFNITADAGYVIKAIKINGNSTTGTAIGLTSGSYTIKNVSNSMSISVDFAKLYTITASATIGGSIDPDGAVTVQEGTDKSFDITADSGYVIKAIKVDGTEVTDSSIGTASGSYTISNVDKDQTISVNFAKLYTITASATTGGSIDPDGAVTIQEGKDKAFDITADSGYVIKAIKVDGTEVTDSSIGTPSGSYTISNVDKDQTINVDFAKLYTITASATTGGSIDPDGTVTVQEGKDKSFDITADSGYVIKAIKVDGSEVTDSSIGTPSGSYTISNVDKDQTISIDFAKLYTITASATTGGSIDPDGAVTVEEGSDKTFDITADIGYVIKAIKVDGTSVSAGAIGSAAGSYVLADVKANHTVLVEFVKLYTITATAGSGGNIDPDGTISVEEGSDKTFDITADSGYMIEEVRVDGDVVTAGSIGTASGIYTFSNITEGHTIDVSFIKIKAVTINTPSSGSISPAGIVSVGEGGEVTFEITADPGHVIKTIKVDGNPVTSDAIGKPSGTFTLENITSDTEIDVEFTLAYNVTSSATTGGSIDPSGTNLIMKNTDISYEITADTGYMIEAIKVDGVSISHSSVGTTSGIYTLSNVTEEHTIVVDFKLIPPEYSITASATTGGSISPSGVVKVAEGSDITFEFTADSGYMIDEVRMDGNVVVDSSIGTKSGVYIFSNVTEGHTLDVDFKVIPNMYSITAGATAGGSITPSGVSKVEENQDIIYEFAADAGYMIKAVKVDGTVLTHGSIGTASGIYAFNNVTAGHTIDVEFVKVNTVTINVPTSGSISPSGVVHVEEGDDLAIEISADPGYIIKSITANGSPVTSDVIGKPSGTFTLENVSSNTTIDVKFVKAYSITANVSAGGSIDPSGTVTVQEGADQTFDITADTGYIIKEIKIDGVSISHSAIGMTSGSYTFGSVTEARNISIEFGVAPKVYLITASATTGGSIDPSGVISVNENSDMTFNITADQGYEIKTVTVDGKAVDVGGTTSGSHTFANIKEGHVIHAEFAKIVTKPFPFTDVPTSFWGRNAVEYVFNNGLMNGVTATLFKPNEPMSRGMFSAVVGRIDGIQDGAADTGFKDVRNTAYFASHIKWGSEEKILFGVGNDKFEPNRQILRQEVAAIMVRYLEYKGITLTTAGAAGFTDLDKANAYAKEDILKVQAAGIMTGTKGNRFEPKRAISRAEAAQMLMNFYEEYK